MSTAVWCRWNEGWLQFLWHHWFHLSLTFSFPNNLCNLSSHKGLTCHSTAQHFAWSWLLAWNPQPHTSSDVLHTGTNLSELTQPDVSGPGMTPHIISGIHVFPQDSSSAHHPPLQQATAVPFGDSCVANDTAQATTLAQNWPPQRVGPLPWHTGGRLPALGQCSSTSK